jgi:hypothetical protein
MINNGITTKFDNLLKIAKTYTFTSASRFIELVDKSDGWSDGYIADFGNKDIARSKAMLKGVVASGNKPEISKIIPNGNRVVDNVEYSLDNNCAVLKSKELNCYVNPSFVKYFYNAYKYFTPKFILTDELKPVKVVYADKLAGLIMPIRV